MAKLDLQAYPDLARLMSRRERESNYVRSQREISHERSDGILAFWQELAGRIEQEDELDNMSAILRELRGDIDMLKSLRETLLIQQDDPEHASQLVHIMRLLMLLLEIYEKFKRWHWHLRDRLLAYHLSVNPAIPSKAKKKRDAEKDEKKKGQRDAKRVLDMSRKKQVKPTKEKQA